MARVIAMLVLGLCLSIQPVRAAEGDVITQVFKVQMEREPRGIKEELSNILRNEDVQNVVDGVCTGLGRPSGECKASMMIYGALLHEANSEEYDMWIRSPKKHMSFAMPKS